MKTVLLFPFVAIPAGTIFPVLGAGVGTAAYAAAAVLIVVALLLFVLVLRGVGPIFESEENVKRFRFGPVRDRGVASPPPADPDECPELDSNQRPIP
jgi:hypothetical protein